MANLIQRIFKSSAPAPSPSPQSNQNAEDAQSFNYQRFTNNVGYDLSQPRIDINARGAFVPFGSDNLYPQHLIDMYYSSPFHSSILKFTSDILMASDIEVDIKGKDGLEKDLQLTRLKRKMSPKFIRQVALETLIHNRNTFLVHKTNGTVKNVEVIGAEKVRTATNKKGYLINEDWQYASRKEKFITKLNHANKEGGVTELLQLQQDSPGQRIYSLPQYVSASNWIWLDSQVSYFQKQNIQNSINPSAIIKIYKQFANKDDKQKYISSLQQSMAGARNAGKVVVLTSKDKETAPDISMMDANKLDEAFADVQTSIVNNIAYAHQISPVVMGVATSGKLGATSEILDSFAIFSNTKLKAVVIEVEEILNTVAQLYNVDANVKINLSEDFINALKDTAEKSGASAVQLMINALK